MRHSRTQLIAAMFVCVCMTAVAKADHHGQDEGRLQPHILMFLVDDLGWQDISVPLLYEDGQAVVTERNALYHTPHIAALAEQGVAFTQAYAEPVCSPTRVSLMTGTHSATHRVTNWVHTDGNDTTHGGPLDPPTWARHGMSEDQLALPRLLSEGGYHAVLVGKAHLASHGRAASNPTHIGFDLSIAGSEIGHPGSYFARDNFGENTRWAVPDLSEHHGTELHLTDALTLEANHAAEEAVEEGKPLFTYLSHYAVHSPFQIDTRYTDDYSELEGAVLGYATLVEGTDVSLGQVLDKLHEMGIAEETLVIFASDNGGDNPLNPPSPPLRGKKGQLYEGGIRIPLIVAWAEPNAEHPLQQRFPVAPGEVHHGIVHIRDMFATLLQAAGAERPATPDSFNLLPTLADPAQNHRPQQLLMHFPHRRHGPNHRWNQFPASVYREGPWKLIYNYETQQPHLYNLDQDIGEQNDLASEEPERTREMLLRMRQQLDLRDAAYPLDRETGAPVRPVPDS